MNKEAAERYTEEYKHWDLLELGWKYNMSDIQAALLMPQLAKVEQYWKRREYVYRRYLKALSSVKDVDSPKLYANAKSGYHLFTIWVDPKRRDDILKRLQQKGVGVAVNYRSINLLTKFRKMFGKGEGSFPVAERIGNSTISLPLYPRLTEDEIDYVIRTVEEVATRTV